MNEREPAPSSVRDGTERRKKRQRDAAEVLRTRELEGPERRTRVAQSTISFRNVAGIECAECGRENFTWVTECRCGAVL